MAGLDRSVFVDKPRSANPGEDAAPSIADIANGRLSSMDSRYIRALAKRFGA